MEFSVTLSDCSISASEVECFPLLFLLHTPLNCSRSSLKLLQQIWGGHRAHTRVVFHFTNCFGMCPIVHRIAIFCVFILLLFLGLQGPGPPRLVCLFVSIPYLFLKVPFVFFPSFPSSWLLLRAQLPLWGVSLPYQLHGYKHHSTLQAPTLTAVHEMPL